MQSLKKFVKVDLVFSAGIFQPMKKMVVKNGVRCGGTRLKTNILGCDNKMAFMDRSIGDYFSNFVLVFRFLLRMTSIS